MVWASMSGVTSRQDNALCVKARRHGPLVNVGWWNSRGRLEAPDLERDAAEDDAGEQRRDGAEDGAALAPVLRVFYFLSQHPGLPLTST